ncbi:hypothetical protein LCGC14_0275570 [marine sediment metagenome]|uniref:Calcineurin-like phosphoesterase domain-containing protein n=1 Tax=marine sediment metagenome TaxID=412755 RepID=A0A0F9UEF7_9ZZZZ
MSNVWFTADQHFGHRNIIKFCNRPFESVEEMDAEMIRRWNAVVEPGDAVYHLGDFTMEGYAYAKEIFAQLNGRVRILSLLWHHDRRWLKKAQTAPPHTQDKSYVHSQTFVRLLPPIEVITVANYADSRSTLKERPVKITLGHYPMASWEASYHGAWHLHGHSHDQYHGGGFMLDVGVDGWAYAPVSLDEIRTYMKTQEGEVHARQGA